MDNRGGKSLLTGEIGRLKVIRQIVLNPGERLDARIRGNVRLAATRQRTSVYLHAKMEAFAAPLRWYYPDWTEYIKEGVSTSRLIPTMTGLDWTSQNARVDTTQLGIGFVNDEFCKWYAQHIVNIWNEWFRWPEDARISVLAPPISFFQDGGPACINLPSNASRMHNLPVFDTNEVNVASATTLDVRQLALVQARMHQAAVTDWSAQDRYKDFIRDVYGPRAKGSNEVDQVPIRLQRGSDLSVSPHTVWANDGPSLGELMALANFNVSHQWSNFIAPEHMVVAFVMLLRFSPILQDGPAPGIYPSRTAYAHYQADPNVLSQMQPVAVSQVEIDQGDSTVMGYLPAGWQHRGGFDHIDDTVADLGNFPLLTNQPATAAGYRDATLINGDIFRTTALKHWFADLDMSCSVDSMIPSAGQSITAGSNKRGGLSGDHPTGYHLI